MAPEERTYRSCETENNLNKMYEDEAYKSRHYKKRLLLGYRQCELNEAEQDAHEETVLAFNQPGFKLVDLPPYTTDSYSKHFKNASNLFIRRSEKRKLADRDLNAAETSDNQRSKVNRTDDELKNEAQVIPEDVPKKLEDANCSTTDIRHFGHSDSEVPLNLAINKCLPASEDTCEEPSLSAKIPSTEN